MTLSNPSRLGDLLEKKQFLLADGGTGTGLFARGLETGDSPELWTIEHPERVRDLHREFVAAGSDIILTDSFGGNRYRLMLHGLEARVSELGAAAARLAREVADEAGRPILVAGSIGPTGDILAPVGPRLVEEAEEAFAEQAKALASGGADLLWIETMSSLEELDAALRGAARAGLPVVATMSFDTNGRTMMGITPAHALAHALGQDPHPGGFGANCGIGPAQLLASLVEFRDASANGTFIVAKANCGIPEYREGTIHYTGTPEIMARYAVLARDAGARIIGGCCGTTGEHIMAMRRALDKAPAGPVPHYRTIEDSLGPIVLPTKVDPPTQERRRRRRG